MKKTKIVALAMSVSLVLGGAYIIDSKTNIAYAEEEKTIDQQMEEKEANIQKLEQENTKIDKEVSDLEKGLENLNKLNKELDVLTAEADKLYDIYAPKYEEWEKLDNLVNEGIAKRGALYEEYAALKEALAKDPTNEDIKAKMTAKSYEWSDQDKKVNEDIKKRHDQKQAMEADEKAYAEADAKYLQKKAEVSEEEKKVKDIYDQIEEKKAIIKDNSRKINVLENQRKTLEALKSKEDEEIAVDDNEDGDKNKKPLDQQITDDKEKLDKLNEENKKQNDEINKLKEQMAETTSLRKEFEELKKDRDAKYDTYVNTSNELDKYRMEYSNAGKLKTELANSYFDAKNKLKENPNDEKLKKDVAEKLKAWQENNKKMEEADQASQKAEKKLLAADDDYKAINKKYKEFKVDLESKEDKNQELEFKIGLINKKIKKNESKIKALNSKLEANNIKVLNESKENANKEIDENPNLSKEEKDNAKIEITKADSVEKVKAELKKAKALADKNLEKANKQAYEKLADAKEDAKKKIDENPNLSKEEKDKAKSEVSKADSIEKVEDELNKAKKLAKDNLEEAKKLAKAKEIADNLADSKASAIAEIGNNPNLSGEEISKAIANISKSDSIEKVNEELEKAKKLAKKHLDDSIAAEIARQKKNSYKENKDTDSQSYAKLSEILSTKNEEKVKTTKKKHLSAKTILNLKKAVARNKTVVKAAELLLDIAPQRVAKVRHKLVKLIKESKELIKLAEKKLAEYNN